MIEAARQPLCPAAVALVEANDIPAGGPCLVRDAAHVMRRARPFEAMEENQRPLSRVRFGGQVGGRGRMDVAVREHARVGRDVEVPLNRRGQPWKMTPPRPRVQRQLVAAGKPGPVNGRLERSWY